MRFITPMQPTLKSDPFSHPDWIYELKHDGYRGLLFHQNGIRLFSRRQNDLTNRFRELQFELKHECLLDGEIVALDPHGKPCFNDLRSKSRYVVFYAFDVLFLDGQDLRSLPLLERKRRLKKLIPKNSRIRFTDHIAGKGEELFNECEKFCLEGMVAKKANSLYVSGRTRDWLKIKTAFGREEMRKRSETWNLESGKH